MPFAACVRLAAGRNALYGKEEFIRGMAEAAASNQCVGTESLEEFRGRKRAAALHGADPRSRHRTPSWAWLLSLIRGAEGMEEALSSSAAESLRVMREAGLMPERVVIAIDEHWIPSYCRKAGLDLVRGRHRAGTSRFEAYMTAQMVVAGARLHLAAVRMRAGDDAGEAVRSLLEQCARLRVRPDLVLADRGFYSVRVLRAIGAAGLPYLAPCPNTSRVVGALRAWAARGGGGGNAVPMCMESGDGSVLDYAGIIVPRRSGRGGSPEAEYVMFATNAPSADAEEYASRWGIETGYRELERMRARTRGRGLAARTFCFFFSLMAANAHAVAGAVLNARAAARAAAGRAAAVPPLTLAAFRAVLRAALRRAARRAGPAGPPAPG